MIRTFVTRYHTLLFISLNIIVIIEAKDMNTCKAIYQIKIVSRKLESCRYLHERYDQRVRGRLRAARRFAVACNVRATRK